MPSNCLPAVLPGTAGIHALPVLGHGDLGPGELHFRKLAVDPLQLRDFELFELRLYERGLALLDLDRLVEWSETSVFTSIR